MEQERTRRRSRSGASCLDRRILRAVIAALAIAAPQLVFASEEAMRTEFFNANIWQEIDADTGMSFSVWSTKRKSVERDGGSPSIAEDGVAGYCFVVTTCTTPAGSCAKDIRACGDFNLDEDLKSSRDAITIRVPGYVFKYAMHRRGVTARNERDRAFDASVTEDASRTVSTEGVGSLSSPYGSFSGPAYHNQGFTRHRERLPKP